MAFCLCQSGKTETGSTNHNFAKDHRIRIVLGQCSSPLSFNSPDIIQDITLLVINNLMLLNSEHSEKEPIHYTFGLMQRHVMWCDDVTLSHCPKRNSRSNCMVLNNKLYTHLWRHFIDTALGGWLRQADHPVHQIPCMQQQTIIITYILSIGSGSAPK